MAIQIDSDRVRATTVAMWLRHMGWPRVLVYSLDDEALPGSRDWFDQGRFRVNLLSARTWSPSVTSISTHRKMRWRCHALLLILLRADSNLEEAKT
jgi:hypothetical protein